MKTTLLALASVLALASAACSSSDSGGTVTKTDAATDTKTETGAEVSVVDTGTVTVETGGGGDDECFAAASGSACQQCCGTNHMEAYQAFVTTLLTCGCKPGNCDTQCASTACASTPATPDSTCAACLNGIQAGACKTDLQTACGAGGPCADFAECASGCPM